MRSENWSMAWSVIAALCITGFVCLGLAVFIEKHEPTFTLTSKDWECIAWRAASVASAETECTIYWRVN